MDNPNTQRLLVRGCCQCGGIKTATPSSTLFKKKKKKLQHSCDFPWSSLGNVRQKQKVDLIRDVVYVKEVSRVLKNWVIQAKDKHIFQRIKRHAIVKPICQKDPRSMPTSASHLNILQYYSNLPERPLTWSQWTWLLVDRQTLDAWIYSGAIKKWERVSSIITAI